VYSGKVRDLYVPADTPDGADAARLLVVASDRVSAFDHVLEPGIPGKGELLTTLSLWWFDQLAGGDGGRRIPNHLVADHRLGADDSVHEVIPAEVAGRTMLVKTLVMYPVECVVRGYLTGSGWKDYVATGAVAGIQLPEGLRDSEQLPEPIFTPSTKADVGHDETIDFDRAAEIVGDRAVMEQLRDLSIALYSRAAEHARERGVILADTKFEFGFDTDGVLRVGDEVLTPDSSRFWPADTYEVGRPQPSFDKQYVRDWAAGTGWDKTPPAPAIPDDVVAGTRARYIEAYETITGDGFDAWLERTAP
jgi:phosphoribosylaminoimidazole-succinocarboxamide synthase